MHRATFVAPLKLMYIVISSLSSIDMKSAFHIYLFIKLVFRVIINIKIRILKMGLARILN